METLPFFALRPGLRLPLAGPDSDALFRGHLRIQALLHTHGLREKEMPRDGNCMFASFSDQLLATRQHHAWIRRRCVSQLRCEPELYEAFAVAPGGGGAGGKGGGGYGEYCGKMAKGGTWGDNLALKALADAFGVVVCLVTSYEDEPFIRVEPRERRSEKVVWMSFFAEVHYNSVYGEGELCPDEVQESKKCVEQ